MSHIFESSSIFNEVTISECKGQGVILVMKLKSFCVDSRHQLESICGERCVQSLPRNPGQVSYSVWISAPHLLKQGKCSCFSSRKVVVRISYPNPVLALLFYLVSACPVFFKHTLIMERKNMPSTIICCARGGQYSGEWYEDQDSPNSDCLFQL